MVCILIPLTKGSSDSLYRYTVSTGGKNILGAKNLKIQIFFCPFLQHALQVTWRRVGVSILLHTYQKTVILAFKNAYY